MSKAELARKADISPITICRSISHPLKIHGRFSGGFILLWFLRFNQYSYIMTSCSLFWFIIDFKIKFYYSVTMSRKPRLGRSQHPSEMETGKTTLGGKQVTKLAG